MLTHVPHHFIEGECWILPCLHKSMHALLIWCNELIEVHVVTHVTDNSDSVYIVMYLRESYTIAHRISSLRGSIDNCYSRHYSIMYNERVACYMQEP